MIWNDIELGTIGELYNAIVAINASDDREKQATEFMAQYRAESEHADANIGYLTGYAGREQAERMRKLFGTPHPIFGMDSPSADEALAAGKEWAMQEDAR